LSTTERLKGAARLAAFSYRRAGEIYYGRDLATVRRLTKQGRITYGVGTYGVPPVFTFVHDKTCLRVGNYSSIGSTIMLGGEHAPDRVTTYPHRIMLNMEGAGQDGFPVHTGDTVIGSDVWTGYGSMLLSGVQIGNGALVAAGAMVCKDVPPYAVVGGNPAKIIKHRFEEEQIAALLDIRWWDWPEDEVRAAVPILASKDIDEFIEYARRRFPQPRLDPTGSSS
jgi:acetyltransferase-like isoleucine patch superfamily enzyme